MKILLIHNKYGKFSGEEAVVDSQIRLLRAHGHKVVTYFRSSEELDELSLGKVRAFFTGFYNPKSIKEIKEVILKERPELVHIHNLYPLISPAILPMIKSLGIPIVMSVHNYRLICPNGLFFSQGEICERCNSGLHEWNCISRNCEGSIFKSSGYALRNFWSRKQGYYLDHIDAFICLTQFQKRKLVEAGFAEEKCHVIPNFYDGLIEQESYADHKRTYVAYAGRFSEEKGIELLLRAAEKLPHVSVSLAGNHKNGYLDHFKIPENVHFVGMLGKSELNNFYKGAKFIVLTSIWYEGFPMVIPEAMVHSLPVVAPDLAGFPEIIGPENGLLYPKGDADALADAMDKLWNNPELCVQMGENAHQRVSDEFNRTTYYKSLLRIYESQIKS